MTKKKDLEPDEPEEKWVTRHELMKGVTQAIGKLTEEERDKLREEFLKEALKGVDDADTAPFAKKDE